MKKNKFRDDKNFKQRLNDRLELFGYKVGSNKILCSLRDGIAVSGAVGLGMILPAIIATFFLNNTTMLGSVNGIHDTKAMIWITKNIYPWFLQVQQVAGVMLALVTLIGISFFIATNYQKSGSPIITVFVSIGAFLALAPFGIDWMGAFTYGDGKGTIPWDNGVKFDDLKLSNLGTDGIVISIIIGICAPLLHIKITNIKFLTIKLPAQVPPAIAGVLSSIFHITLTLFVFATISWSWAYIAHWQNITMPDKKDVVADNIFEITKIAFTPLQSMAQSPWCTFMLAILVGGLWIFGLHGPNIAAPLAYAIYIQYIYVNIYFWATYTNPTIQSLLDKQYGTSISDAYYDITKHIQQGVIDLLNFFKQHKDNMSEWTEKYGKDAQAMHDKAAALSKILDPEKGIFVSITGNWHKGLFLTPLASSANIGGTGVTIGLTYSLLTFGRFKPHRTVAKIEAIPAIFNINEPLIFGLPIIFNFKLAMPFIAINAFGALISQYLVVWHLMRPTVAQGSPFFPSIIGNYITSGFDWRTIIFTTALTIVSFIVYSFYIKSSQNYSIKALAKTEGITSKEWIEQNQDQFEPSWIDKMSKLLFRKNK